MDSEKDSSTVGGSGLFDFSGLGDKSAGDVWTLPEHQSVGSIRSPWLSQHNIMMSNQPSPAVPRSAMESKALKRRSGATELIKRSLAALDEVVSTPSLQPHTPGSLLKESFRANRATPIIHKDTSTVQTPVASLSIMDETGLTRELCLATSPIREDDTVMDFPRDQTFLNTTLFGSNDRRTGTNNLEDPVEKTSRYLVTVFHECYSKYNTPADSLELIGHLQEACEKQVQDVTVKTGSSRLLSELLLERSVWELISVLYSDRIEVERMTDEDMATDVLGLKGVSDKETADDFFIKESTVRQAQLVVDWLEKNAVTMMEKNPVKINYFADSVCWENTLHSIQRNMDHDRIISEMDPDAPRRQGRHLAELDEKDEQSLVKHLFTCIRAGQVTKAQELCVQCGQSWRAATLEGWKLHHDSNYGKNVNTDDLDPVEGNITRDLWKLSVWELANDPNYNHNERALYAALSGNIKHILPACNNWLDYVWAHFKVMVDVLTEQKLRGFSPSTGHPMESLPTEYWNALLVPELIFQEIEASHSAVVQKESLNPFHVAHKFIILGNLNGLISEMHEWLVNNPNLYQLRFMAHLVLFTQGLGEANTEDQLCSDILEAYVKELTKDKFSTFVALYTARLPRHLQISCYANLLEDIVDPENQRRCLELGNEVGLDIAVITKSVVEHMRNTGTEDIVTVSGPELAPQTVTQLDKSKIEVIRWLVFDKDQRAEALKQGNALIRQFLATRKLSAANALFKKIPSDSINVVTRNWNMKAGDSPLPDDLANDIHEYRCIQAYLECHTSFNDWFHHYHHNRPEAPPGPSGFGFKDNVAYEHKLKQYQSEEEAWKTRLQALTKDAEDRLYCVLLFDNGGWMVDQAQRDAVDERREKQLQLLREVCIPQTTFLLHTVLDCTQQTRKCLQLADIIASEGHQLYKVFHQHELQRLISLIHKTASSALADRHSELGYPL